MSDVFLKMQRERLKRATAFAREQQLASFSSNSTQTFEQEHYANAYDDNDDDTFANILSLKLRKPKHWKWELSTSRSSNNIALPRILLYNHKGDLLVDADGHQEQTYKQPTAPATNTTIQNPTKRKYPGHAATTNLAQSIRQALESEFNGLQIAEATPSPLSSAMSTPLPQKITTASTRSIDLNTFELPDYKYERRSNSLKGVHFKADYSKAQNELYNLINLPTPPSTTTPTTPSTSSTGPREKRRFRRTQSSSRSPAQSESILERFSLSRGRFSSPEYAEEHELYHAPSYFLRTSKAGTLIVQEESFSRCRRRRKPRHSSSENLLNSSKNQSTSSLKTIATARPTATTPLQHEESENTIAAVRQHSQRSRSRRKTQPIRRYCSDGNFLSKRQLSSSEEELAEEGNKLRFSNCKQKTKRDLVRLDSGVSSAYTAR